MTDTSPVAVDPSNEAAYRAWDGADGEFWAAHESYFDRSLARYDPALLAAAAIGPRDRVLDVGCGTGHTSRAAARLARDGAVVGIDLSSPMLERARERAHEERLGNVTFVHADAQVHPFDAASFDVVISRTGTMFFGVPAAAFANLRRALRPGGRLAMLVWQPVHENEWLTSFTAALAAGRSVPAPPPDSPGPFSLSDPQHVTELLEGAGLAHVVLDGRNEPMEFGRTADDAYENVAAMGFTTFMLDQLDPAARPGALACLRASIDAHATPEGVLYRSGVWIVTAHRS